VVMYAATGRTPFAADSPPATAMRILTQPPDLTGLESAILPLVTRALEKDPQRRPAARELLDILLANDRRPTPAPVIANSLPGSVTTGGPRVPVTANPTRWADRDRRGRDGFRTFVTEQRAVLRDLAYLICGDWRVAEEVATGALARSYPRWHTVERPDLHVKTAIVQAAAKASLRPDPSAAFMSTTGSAPAGNRSRLRTAMLLVTPWQRAALGMAYVMRMSREDIAGVLGCPPEQVEVQINLGSAQLTCALAGPEPGWAAWGGKPA
jgi:hypothetical protein